MLYTASERALSKLLSEHQDAQGPIRLIFDMNTLQIIDARHAASIPGDEELFLQPAEFMVLTDLLPAPAPIVSIRCAAFNAIEALREVISLAEQETGPLPPLLGTMHLMADGHARLAPYDQDLLAFTHDDFSIRNPFISECGRFDVDPVQTYGFKDMDAGGGSRTLVRALPGGGHLCLTDATGAAAPSRVGQADVVSRFDADGHLLAYASEGQIPSVDENYPDLLTENDQPWIDSPSPF